MSLCLAIIIVIDRVKMTLNDTDNDNHLPLIKIIQIITTYPN